MTRRIPPRLGDALMIHFESRWIAPFTCAALAECECGRAIYTAVSGSERGCLALLRRKHRKHLPDCTRQHELEALGLTGMTRVQTALTLELGTRVAADPGWASV